MKTFFSIALGCAGVAIAWLWAGVIYNVGVSEGRRMAQESVDASPYWKSCPTPSPVKIVNNDILKDCEFSNGCTFVARWDYQESVRNTLRELKTCQNEAYRLKSLHSAKP